MGGGRDKKKKAKEKKEGPLPGRGLEKTEKHTTRNETKKERRAAKKLAGDEDDIDALLAQFSVSDKSKQSVTISSDCSPPSARVNASFVAFIAPRINEIVMFGGEMAHMTTSKVHVYNDLYRFNCDKLTWTQVSSPNSPQPRCAHQAVIIKGFMYIFGGEFTSPNQEKFHHFRDTWRLNLTSWEWDQLPSKGGPSPRSGHRMVAYKGKIIMFGGFFDNSKETRYYDDLWVFDTETLKWSELFQLPGPSRRGGFQMAVVGDTLWLYGGYSKVTDDDDKDVEHGRVHDDMWRMDLEGLGGTAAMKWEHIKKVGLAPTPRASFAMVPHRTQLVLFGGVSDNEAMGGLDLSSDFHNDLFTFSTDKRRWFATEMRIRPAVKPKESTGAAEDKGVEPQAPAGTSGDAPEGVRRELAALVAASSRDPNSAAARAAIAIQARFRGYVVRKALKTYRIGGKLSEVLYSPAAFGLDLSACNAPKPRARISAQVCVLNNTMWLFGGTVELGSKEITLDDMWSLDLAKLDGWRLIRENTVGEEAFRDSGSSSESSDSEGEESD